MAGILVHGTGMPAIVHQNETLAERGFCDWIGFTSFLFSVGYGSSAAHFLLQKFQPA